MAVAVDGNNIVVGGYFSATVDFGNGPQTSQSTDAFLLKLSPLGTYMWCRDFGGSGFASAQAVAVDATGKVLLTGDFGGGTANFGGTTFDSADAYSAVVVAKYQPDGSHIWSTADFNGPVASGSAVAADLAGSVFVSGAAAFPSVGFLTKFDGGTGQQLWSHDIATSCFSCTVGASDLAIDSTGRVLVVGHEGFLSNAYKAYRRTYSTEGALLDSREFGQNAGNAAHSIALDSQGRSIVTGQFMGQLSSGVVSAGGTDVFVLVLTP
jgi:hypothetical protein